MYNFLEIAKAVDNSIEGIFAKYSIVKLEIKEAEEALIVEAIILNQYKDTPKKYIFIYEWDGSRLHNIKVEVIQI